MFTKKWSSAQFDLTKHTADVRVGRRARPASGPRAARRVRGRHARPLVSGEVVQKVMRRCKCSRHMKKCPEGVVPFFRTQSLHREAQAPPELKRAHPAGRAP